MVCQVLPTLTLATILGSAGVIGGVVGERPPSYPHPCAAPPHGQHVTQFAPPVQSQSSVRSAAPAPALPASSSRIPSPYVRDYGPHAPAWPAPERAPPPREKPLAEPIRSSAAAPDAAPSASRYYDTYYAAAEESAVRQVRDGSRSVSFWNLTSQPLTFRVLGKTYRLERGKFLGLELPRQFVWQIAGRSAETTELADDHVAMEIVIRK